MDIAIIFLFGTIYFEINEDRINELLSRILILAIHK